MPYQMPLIASPACGPSIPPDMLRSTLGRLVSYILWMELFLPDAPKTVSSGCRWNRYISDCLSHFSRYTCSTCMNHDMVRGDMEGCALLVSPLSSLTVEDLINDEYTADDSKDDSILARAQPIRVGIVLSFKLEYIRTLRRMSEFTNLLNIIKHLPLKLLVQSFYFLLSCGGKNVGIHVYTPSSLRRVGPSVICFAFLNPRLTFATNFVSDISTRSIRSSSISSDNAEDGAMIPRTFLSFITVIDDLLIRRSIHIVA